MYTNVSLLFKGRIRISDAMEPSVGVAVAFQHLIRWAKVSYKIIIIVLKWWCLWSISIFLNARNARLGNYCPSLIMGATAHRLLTRLGYAQIPIADFQYGSIMGRFLSERRSINRPSKFGLLLRRWGNQTAAPIRY